MADRTDATLQGLLDLMVKREASDLHLLPGYRPMLRINGELAPAAEGPLAAERLLPMIATLAPPSVAARLGEATDLDFAAQFPHDSKIVRVRVNVMSARGQPGACLRLIP